LHMQGRDLIRYLLRHKFLFLTLQVIGVAVILFWWRQSHLPPPGYAVAVLGVAAAIMSIQEDMQGWQKAIWLLLMGGFLAIELRAISADRKNTADEALRERNAQDQRFADIREAQNEDFKTITKGFTDTLNQNEKEFSATQHAIATTLHAANTTLNQTRPHALLHEERTDFALKSMSPDGRHHQLILHVFLINDGNENVSDVEGLTRAYLLDKPIQEIKNEFENDWKTQATKISEKIPLHEPVQLIDIPSQLSEQEITDLFQGAKIIVYITRIAYKDSTGKWLSDQCSYGSPKTGQPHICSFLNEQRYPAPKNKE
jgi:hypothetical protein